MSTVVTLPKTGDTADSVVVLEWLVAPGSVVRTGDPLVRVETSKVVVEIPAPVGGTVVALLAAIDDEIDVGAPLVEIEPN